MAFRNRATGEYPVSKAELIAAHANTSLPVSWNAAVLDFLGVDEVFPVPQPVVPRYYSIREGAPQLTVKGTWEQTWELIEFTPEQQTELLATVKTERLAELAAIRWERETGGIALAGATINTDRQSQALVNGALALVTANPSIVIDWKGGDGWVQLDAATVQGIAYSVGSHVQACFSRERVLAEQIEAAADFEALEGIDLTAGWP